MCRKKAIQQRSSSGPTFPPKRIGPFVSEVLVLGAYNEAGDVILLRPDTDVSPGSRIG